MPARNRTARQTERTAPPTSKARGFAVSMTVNGSPHEDTLEPRVLLVDFLRNGLHLTGTHVGCDTSQCGACTVLLDGRPVKSCSVLAVQADGSEVTTIEGITPPKGLHPLQEAFRQNLGLQCGYCTPGVVLSAYAFLRRNPTPSEEEIRVAISGNLCRCTGYQGIVKSVAAAASRAGRSGR